MAEDYKPCQPQRVDEDAGRGGTMGAGGGGSNDVTSGGGNAAGIPDAETAMRMGEVVNRGDVKNDREKLFPETAGHPQPGSDAGRSSQSSQRPQGQATAGAADPMGEET
jgi:hypothetical protein